MTVPRRRAKAYTALPSRGCFSPVGCVICPPLVGALRPPCHAYKTTDNIHGLIAVGARDGSGRVTKNRTSSVVTSWVPVPAPLNRSTPGDLRASRRRASASLAAASAIASSSNSATTNSGSGPELPRARRRGAPRLASRTEVSPFRSRSHTTTDLGRNKPR